jgi:hypothetical protein
MSPQATFLFSVRVYPLKRPNLRLRTPFHSKPFRFFHGK